jgi:hypothetical protein
LKHAINQALTFKCPFVVNILFQNLPIFSEAGSYPGRPSRCVYLTELYGMLDQQTWLDIDSLGQVGKLNCAIFVQYGTLICFFF